MKLPQRSSKHCRCQGGYKEYGPGSVIAMLRWHLGCHFVEAFQVIELNINIFSFLWSPLVWRQTKGNQAKQAGRQKLWAASRRLHFLVVLFVEPNGNCKLSHVLPYKMSSWVARYTTKKWPDFTIQNEVPGSMTVHDCYGCPGSRSTLFATKWALQNGFGKPTTYFTTFCCF